MVGDSGFKKSSMFFGDDDGAGGRLVRSGRHEPGGFQKEGKEGGGSGERRNEAKRERTRERTRGG